MNILVCVKPVPDPEQYGQLRLDPHTKRLIREGIDTVINPSDKNALEEAIRLKEALGGKVTVVSMAPEFSRNKIVETLAMGGDEAYLISDPLFGGADTFATSYVLSEAAKKISAETATHFDLILTGNESADGATAQVPAQLAEWLGLPHVCSVSQMEFDKEKSLLKIWKKTETGRILFEGKLPALAAVTRDINKPRLISAMGIIKARKKPLTLWSNEDLGLEESHLGLKGSPTQPGALITPDMKRQAEDLGSDPVAAADKILQIIQKAGV